MKILVVKLTSMGDVLHLMPALSDLSKKYPKARIDWMVEESFAEIPAWHPAVDRVISVATRRWRKWRWRNIIEFFAFIREIRREPYDAIVDAQGLLKSAVFSRFARLTNGGKRIGFSADSIKESPAARFYQHRISIDREQHAVDRLRQLFAQGFAYPVRHSEPDYQLSVGGLGGGEPGRPTVLFFHGTTWPSKHLPDQYWRELADLVTDDGYQIKISWGTDEERQRAEWIAQGRTDVEVLPKSSLTDLARKISSAAGVVAVDTGLGHIAAALGVPTVSVYGATDARLTGALGKAQIHIQTDYPCSPCLLKHCDKLTEQVTEPPCYHTVSAAEIWQRLYEVIA